MQDVTDASREGCPTIIISRTTMFATSTQAFSTSLALRFRHNLQLPWKKDLMPEATHRVLMHCFQRGAVVLVVRIVCVVKILPQWVDNEVGCLISW